MAIRPKAVLIAGPTASGKSSHALEMAKKWDGVVINADSMQVYPVLKVLTARPGDEDMKGVAHKLYGHASLERAYSVAQWLGDVRVALVEIEESGKIPVFVGGTGLYFKALCEGLALIPVIPDDIRRYWRERLQGDGVDILRRELELRDPGAASRLGAGDSQRIVRALEVLQATGRSFLDYQKSTRQSPTLTMENVKRQLILPPRDVLHQRIDERFGAMLESGAVDEVKQLNKRAISSDHPVLKAIGVPQINEYLDGAISLDEAANRAMTATRQYAKRQSTWFRNQLDKNWVVFRQ